MTDARSRGLRAMGCRLQVVIAMVVMGAECGRAAAGLRWASSAEGRGADSGFYFAGLDGTGRAARASPAASASHFRLLLPPSCFSIHWALAFAFRLSPSEASIPSRAPGSIG